MNGTQALETSGVSRVAAIGNFDGVHLGHQALIRTSIACAQQDGLQPLALTFHPHPFEVLVGPGRAVLTPLDRRVELMCRVDPALTVVVETFTRDFASLMPDQFARSVLIRALGARVVVVGPGFRFGQGRLGDFSTLQALGQELGFRAISVEPVVDESGALSSSRVRAAIERADLASAERMLSRPHALTGRVVHGDGRGRSLGVPTANLSHVPELLPPLGVYACLVDRLDAAGQAHVLGIGAMNLGVRPTVEAGFSAEVHVLDFAGDLYGSFLRVHLLARLRGERRFSNLADLIAQIQADLEQARHAAATRRPDSAAQGAWH